MRQAIVLRYAPDRPEPPLKPPSSSDSSSDGNGVSWPKLCAATWSTEMPSRGVAPVSGRAHVSHTADERVWFAPAEASSP